MIDEELDFEEEDFGDINSLLYEDTDDNNKQLEEHSKSEEVDDRSDSQSDKRSEDGIDDRIDSQSDKRSEDGIDDRIDSQSDKRSEDGIDDRSDSQSDKRSEDGIDDRSDSQSDKRSEDGIDDRIDSQSDKRTEDGIDDRIDSQSDKRTEDGIDEDQQIKALDNLEKILSGFEERPPLQEEHPQKESSSETRPPQKEPPPHKEPPPKSRPAQKQPPQKEPSPRPQSQQTKPQKEPPFRKEPPPTPRPPQKETPPEPRPQEKGPPSQKEPPPKSRPPQKEPTPRPPQKKAPPEPWPQEKRPPPQKDPPPTPRPPQKEPLPKPRPQEKEPPRQKEPPPMPRPQQKEPSPKPPPQKEQPSQTEPTPKPPLTTTSKTVDLDKKYYKSMKIFLTEGKIIGYAEDSFRNESKNFKLKKDKLLFHSREVVDTEERQRDIAIEFHLNSAAKSEKSKHRGVVTTVRAVENKYFWGTIKYDVENVINQCRVCNPKEYDLTSYQLWKYIEIGFIERVLIVRDLNEKSSILNCAFLEDINAFNLSKHLIDLFKTYGTPNAIRVVLEKESQNQLTEDLSKYLKNGLLEFIEEVKFVSENSTDKEVIKLPMVQIKIEYDSNKCPKNEKELQTTYAISANDDISLLYIFSCNFWLINNSVFTTIAMDIKNFAQKFNNWTTRLSSLTLYFQINGMNLKANEEEEETNVSQTANKNKRSSHWRELERLQSDSKTSQPSSHKRQNKENQKMNGMVSSKSADSSSDSDWPDEDMSVASSTKRRNSGRSKETHKNAFKEQPFKQVLREQKRLSLDSSNSSQEIEIIDVDDSSQQSLLSQISSVVSVSSESKTPEPVLTQTNKADNSKTDIEKYDHFNACQPCFVCLDHFSQQNIQKAIEGKYDFPEKNINSQISIKAIINEELEKRSKEVEHKSSSDLNLSESSSEEEEEQNKTPPKPKSVSPPRLNTTVSQSKLRSIPVKSQTPVKAQTPARSQRKRKANHSENDSDYDFNKDKSSVSSKKRVKFDPIPKTIVNFKSIERKDKKISRRLIAPSSSDSESAENNEKVINISKTITTKNQKSAINSEITAQVFKCSYCTFSTNEKMTYILHTTKHKDERKNAILCPECSKTFYNKESLEEHKIDEHPIIYQDTILYGCDQCKQFGCSSLEDLDQHLMSHIEDLPYLKSSSSSKHRCELCKLFTAPNKDSMFLHLQKKHRMFKCTFDCHFVAADFQTLERHSKSIHSRYGLPFECKYCELSTAVFGALVQHRQKTHAIDWKEDKTNKCCLCEEVFNYDDTNRILEHLSTHAVDLPYYECKSCHKRCRHLEQLKKHCETHHAVGPADGLEAHIGNLSQLFEELRKELTNQTNKSKNTQTNTSEMQNALLGLLDEEFAEDNQFVDDNHNNDLVATALNFALNGESDGSDLPTISIPETAEEDYFIEEDDDGNWNPVNQ